MTIDAELYRKGLEAYQQWNEAELKARALRAKERDPEAGWEEFNALWSFARSIQSRRSDFQRRQKLEALALYYQRVEQMEEWRLSHGRTTQQSTSASDSNS